MVEAHCHSIPTAKWYVMRIARLSRLKDGAYNKKLEPPLPRRYWRRNTTAAPPAAYRNPASVLPHSVNPDGEVFIYPTIDNLPSKI